MSATTMPPSATAEADLIKSVHSELRLACARHPDRAGALWRRHVQNEALLSAYAGAMRDLATGKWNRREAGETKADRIRWVVAAINKYFFAGDRRRLERRITRKRLAADPEEEATTTSRASPESPQELRVLDVGSCYNPFGGVEGWSTTAIDIAPADPSVLKCDFIHDEGPLLGDSHYDAVIFCLLLEYIPTPMLRRLACIKAARVLKEKGLLVIITPDSNRPGKNQTILKSWQCCLATLGFFRAYYEKLEHVHCLTFIKVKPEDMAVCENEARKLASQLGISSLAMEQGLMVIPQDKTAQEELNKECTLRASEDYSEDETQALFDELPVLDL